MFDWKYMDFGEKVMTVIVFFVLAFGVFGFAMLPFALYYDAKHVDEMTSECNIKGGVLLDHTYRMGKTTYHNYVCVDPKILIPLKGD